ncbi:hypothetical protein AALP_AA1G340900 [Arabis alpina]|uniref:Uncharacterized protein n=1 Tax=Arabis alpina TaxID=50452 RepID=A0A087HSH7_ARAAL|nr:hypothetical protein AALP_AA1G340900 [Arabis alpina]
MRLVMCLFLMSREFKFYISIRNNMVLVLIILRLHIKMDIV